MIPVSPTEIKADSDADAKLELCFCSELGIGVRSLTAFRSGEVLDRFDGNVVSHMSQHSLQIEPGQHIIDTRFVGYLSHGCEPNCELDMHGRKLVALRDIAADELLRVDYSATEDTLFAEFNCACGASNCRGWIEGRLKSEGS